jgi:hypothetical protein
MAEFLNQAKDYRRFKNYIFFPFMTMANYVEVSRPSLNPTI